MKLFAVLATIFLSLSAFGHGEIEMISCISKDKSMVMSMVPVKKGNVFQVHLAKDKKFLLDPTEAAAELKDTFENKQLYENISVSLGKKGSAHMKIAEIPSEEIRKGKGTIIVDRTKAEVDCTAVY